MLQRPAAAARAADTDRKLPTAPKCGLHAASVSAVVRGRRIDANLFLFLGITFVLTLSLTTQQPFHLDPGYYRTLIGSQTVPVKRNVDILLEVPDAVLAHTVCGTRNSVEAIIRIRILLFCPSVPWRCCLGYRHAGCLQLSHRWPPEMCGLRTRPWTDVDPPRFLDPWTGADGLIGGETICHRRTAIGGRAYRLAAPGAIPCFQ